MYGSLWTEVGRYDNIFIRFFSRKVLLHYTQCDKWLISYALSKNFLQCISIIPLVNHNFVVVPYDIVTA